MRSARTGRYSEGGRILSPGQEEPRTPEIGHTISLGAREFVRMPRDYYSFDRLFDRVHELGGVTGFAHQGMSFSRVSRDGAEHAAREDRLSRTGAVLRAGRTARGSSTTIISWTWGYKLTALAGVGLPVVRAGAGLRVQEPRFAQIGNARFYTYTGEPFTFERWVAALKAGHTFVTTGPMLLLKVNDRMPGDRIDVAAGTKAAHYGGGVRAGRAGAAAVARDCRALEGAGAARRERTRST